MQFTQEEKASHLKQWEQSGLSQSAYCREHQIGFATFQYWKSCAKKISNLKQSNTVNPSVHPAEHGFITTQVVSKVEGSVTLSIMNGITLSCQIQQLPAVLKVLTHANS
jgi:transposase-like protein